jgi:hypothetical protein
METALTKNGKYGVFDTKDKCWLGNDDGPWRYDDEMLARAAATIANERMGLIRRFRKMEHPKQVANVLKDEIAPRISGEQAIKNIEGRK